MRIGRQAAAGMREFLPEPVQLILGQPALEECPRVDPGRRVSLEEHLIARLAEVLAAEEVVVPDLIEAGRRGVGGDVAADAQAGPVGAGDHDGGVPPDVGADAPLDVLIAGEPGLALRRDRVDVVGAAQPGHADLLFPGPFQQPQHHVPAAGPAAGPDNRVEGLDPFPGLVGVDIGQLGGQAVADDREALASGGHGVSSPSTVAGKSRFPSLWCVGALHRRSAFAGVLTNPRTRWPPAHLYWSVIRIAGPAGHACRRASAPPWAGRRPPAGRGAGLLPGGPWPPGGRGATSMRAGSDLPAGGQNFESWPPFSNS